MLIPLFLSAILATWPQPSIDGVASWYGNPRAYGEPAIAWYTRKSEWGNPVKHYAAAGPELRKMIGDPNPYHEHYPLYVTNRKTGKTIRVVVVDWCQCSKGKRSEKLIDLSPAAFVAVCGPLGKGICSVTVSPVAPPPRPHGTLPPGGPLALRSLGGTTWTESSSRSSSRSLSSSPR